MKGHIIPIYSSKGGVGKSFIAVNLAVNVFLETNEKVLLIDFSRPVSSDIGCLLGLSEIKRIDNLLPMVDKLYPNILKGYATTHTSGISVLNLADGARPLEDELFNPKSIARIMACLQSVYSYIIVDMGVKFDGILEAIFERASMVLIPFTPDTLSIRQMQNDLMVLRNNHFSGKLIKIILNRVDKTNSGLADALADSVGRKPDAAIPLDPDAESNQVRGTYPEKMPRHPVTKAIDSLTYTLIRETRDLASRNTGEGTHGNHPGMEDVDDLKRSIHERLLESIDFKKLDIEIDQDREKANELKVFASQKISEILDYEFHIQDRQLCKQLVKDVLQEALGLGPIEDLLDDPEISEIMVNAWNDIYVEKKGRLVRMERKFFSEKHLLNIISRITAPLGRKIDTSTPMVDARLKDGSRVNAIIPPLAVRGACLTIRKFPEEQIGIPELLTYETANEQIVEFLKAAVQSKLNILISGGTSSGKTTLLNILSSFVPESERIVTIEDAAELRLRQPHVITLESRPPNIEGRGAIVIRDLVKNSLRMRPDRIVVGECRGAEALDMLQAMNTGHEGSLTTIHSNSCREAISRLETLVLYSGFDLPIKAIKEQIAGAIDVIVQISRFKDGSRKVIQVAEVDGMQGDDITLDDIFVYRQSGEKSGKITGEFSSTGYVPKCIDRFVERGIHIPREVFWTGN